tara:strand:- start:10021 stop:10572 length:552 start_codon:yes stop_codon:yes gene_type:complete
MGYIKTLQNYNFNFKELPIEILENVRLILSQPIVNQKISLLDSITFNMIRETQPTNEIIETLFDVYQNENTLRDNNGFNSLREIDEAQELFDDSFNNMTSDYYNNLIPNGYEIKNISFDRTKYGYLEAKNWLKDNKFESKFYPEITSQKIIFNYTLGAFVLNKKKQTTLNIEFTNSINAAFVK